MIVAIYTAFGSLPPDPVAEILLVITLFLFVHEAVVLVAIDILLVERIAFLLEIDFIRIVVV